MRTHHDHARALRAFTGDDGPTKAATLALLRQLPPDGSATCPGPEELLEALESRPGADRAAVVDYFTYRPGTEETPCRQ